MTGSIQAAIGIAILAGAAWGGYEWRDRAADAEMATIVADQHAEIARVQAWARKVERDAYESMNRIAEQHEQDKRNALAAKDRTISDLRAGNVQLREHWRGCATDRVSSDATAARLADEVAQLRREGAGRIVRIADEADAQVRGLQRVIEAYQVER